MVDGERGRRLVGVDAEPTERRDYRIPSSLLVSIADAVARYLVRHRHVGVEHVGVGRAEIGYRAGGLRPCSRARRMGVNHAADGRKRLV